MAATLPRARGWRAAARSRAERARGRSGAWAVRRPQAPPRSGRRRHARAPPRRTSRRRMRASPAGARPWLGRNEGLARGRVLLRELAAQGLADQCLRKRIAELDLPRDFERSEALTAVRDELLGRRGRTGLQDDERLHLLACEGGRDPGGGRV